VAVKTYRIETIHHVVDIATAMTRSWFRGQSKAVGELVPRIFRQAYRGAIAEWRPAIELETIDRFMRDAPNFTERPLPAVDDHLSWLCLMQHHGAPTRLLDWSERALVALYFATSTDFADDGELWVMDPYRFNEASTGYDGLPLVGYDRTVKFLVQQPFWDGTPESLAERCLLPFPVNKPIAFLHRREVRRIAAQSGAFTLHPPPGTGLAAHEVTDNERYLVRYVIPASVKGRLRDALVTLGVSRLQLFQDLDSLSAQVCADHDVIAYGPPKPPRCAGEVPD
jgi:hypothetical protein